MMSCESPPPRFEIAFRSRGGFREPGLRIPPKNEMQLRATSVQGCRQIDMLANYVLITPMPKRVINMYRIDYEPEVESEKLMRFLFRTAASQLFAKMPIFDGRHECRSGQKLTNDVSTTIVQDNQSDSTSYTVRITHTGTSCFGPKMSSIYNMQIEDFLRTKSPLFMQNGLSINQYDSPPVSPDILLIRRYITVANLHHFNNMMNLWAAHKSDRISASRVATDDEVIHMRKFLSTFHTNETIRDRLSSWANNYDTDLARLKAHVVATSYDATPRSKAAAFNSCPQAHTGSANIRNQDLAVKPYISKMAIIIAKPDLKDKSRILRNLKHGFDAISLRVGSVQKIDILDGEQTEAYIDYIRTVAPDTDCAIVIMNRQHKGRYDAIKKVASVEMGLITQVVFSGLILNDKNWRSVSKMIAIQIAARVGFKAWCINLPLKKAMICGYDTCHDTAQRGRSYGAFVASLDVSYSCWWSNANAHDRIDDISAQLSTNIVEAIKHYKKFNNNELPDKIMLYRDGEGQLLHVFQTELKNIKAALKSVSPTIKLTMILVNQRIGVRFYLRYASNESFMNPPPETDQTVTRQKRNDFYLISQSTRQGSITPTYYNIIHDESTLSPDIQQVLAYKLTLAYFNWSGTIRVPAPCQYAGKLAMLCGKHIHAQPNAVLQYKLHFL